MTEKTFKNILHVCTSLKSLVIKRVNSYSVCPLVYLGCEGQLRCCFFTQFSAYSITVDTLSGHYLLRYGFLQTFKFSM